MSQLQCPACQSIEIDVLYTAPLQYSCRACGVSLRDKNAAPAIEVLDDAASRRRRPVLYGAPACSVCEHAKHNLPCDKYCLVCLEERDKAKRAVELIVISKQA